MQLPSNASDEGLNPAEWALKREFILNDIYSHHRGRKFCEGYGIGGVASVALRFLDIPESQKLRRPNAAGHLLVGLSLTPGDLKKEGIE